MTRHGFPAVLIDDNDYYVKLAEICKYTLVGKFTNTMPRMDQVRKSFILQTQMMGEGLRSLTSTLGMCTLIWIMNLTTKLFGLN